MANSDCKSLTMVSFNLHGLNQGKCLLTKLLKSYSANLIFIQEHWQTPANMNKINQLSSDYTSFGISAMDSVVSRSILRGRCFGGVAILCHNKLLPESKCIHCSERFVIIMYRNTLFINVYLPCSSVDNQINVAMAMLEEIGSLINDYPWCNIVCGGDMNTNLYMNSPMSNLF